QQQQFQRKFHNQFQLPRPTPLCFPPSFATTSAFNHSSLMIPKKNVTSENESVTKEETPREIFFKTLSSSLKEANKFYSKKTTSWKNPFLYKTHLCENFCNRQYCRFGVNCWYAHGSHELRYIPDSNELPDADFITQYLSFLGLPSQTLEQIIQNAYYVANLLTSSESPWFSLSKSSFPDLPSINSASNSQNSDIPSEPINIPIISKSKRDKFYSSYISNGGGGWAIN
uniref:C3H1-type domain-containing protein n=1 Tax=Panagrolaimus sp. PS1159 TaxID=55785 RepID=A0AC35GE50_9BILA